MTTALLAITLALALLGAPVFAALGALALLGFHAGGTAPEASAIEIYKLTGAQAVNLSTIPLFTFSGYLMAEARTAHRLVALSRALLGWMPGGLALVTLATCAFFTTFTGASGVTIIAIGGLLLPSLLKEGYPERFSLGLVTGSGSIGLMFPPALPLIIYGIVCGLTVGSDPEAALRTPFSVERFMFAGIVPGLVLLACVGGYAMVQAIRAGVPRTRLDLRAAGRAAWEAKWELPIPFVLLGLLVTGKLQIPELAAVTAAYVFVIEVLIYRDVRLRADLPRIVRDSMTLVGAIFVIIAAATALTGYFVDAEVPNRLYEWTKQYIGSRWTFLLALNGLLLIVGCLMDIFSAILVCVPLLVPAAQQYGVDLYHLGVIFLVNLEIGYLTPPVGLNLFITSFRFGKPMTTVYRAALPFILVMLVALGLITYVPQLTLVRAPPAAAHIDLEGAPAAPAKPYKDPLEGF